MQEIITYTIGAAAAIIIARWLYRTLKGKNKECCDCTCCDECDKHNL